MVYPVVLQLQQSGHLLRVADSYYRFEEERALNRLLKIQPRTFLQDYDVLFRYVSIWLLEQGYVLTNYQPHQVLARVCEQVIDRQQVSELIRCRHELKYDGLPATKGGSAALLQLLSHFCKTLESGEALKKSAE